MLAHAIVVSRWDYVLAVVVATMAIPIAYLRHPRWKAFIVTLPFPFTVATLSVGQPINATHVAGLLVLLAYTHGVRLLYQRLRVPIFLAIVLSAAGYCAVGTIVARLAPKTPAAFWTACAVAGVVAVVCHRALPPREEPGHRSTLPIWIKAPLVIVVVGLLVVLKESLQGFMTLFPMVGVFAAYESRHSLWTLCRQIPILTMLLLPMMVTIYLVQGRIGLGPGLAVGWGVYLIGLAPYMWRLWLSVEKPGRGAEQEDVGAEG